MVEYLQFREDSIPGRKTQRWDVESSRKGTYLGTILWRGGWRQYVFEPADDTVFSAGCMRDICDFIDRLMAARRG